MYRYLSVSAVWSRWVTGIMVRTFAATRSSLSPASAARAASMAIQPWHSAALRVSITSTRRSGICSSSMDWAMQAAWYAPLAFEVIWRLMISCAPDSARLL